MEESTEAPEGLLLPNRPPRIQSPPLLNLSLAVSPPSFNRLSFLTVVSTSASSAGRANPSLCVFTCDPQQTWSPDCTPPASQTQRGKGRKIIPLSLSLPPPLRHGRDPSPHDSRPVFLLAAAFVCSNNSKSSKRRKKKKSKWKEPAYLSFPIVYLFHGKLIFTSPVTGSSLGSTARPVWLWPPLPSLSRQSLWPDSGEDCWAFQLASHSDDTIPPLS